MVRYFMNINETIKTELNYKDIALIAVALGDYQRNYKDIASQDVLKQAANLVDRLNAEMYNCEDDGESGS
jgi:hypothetical protein